MLTDGIGRRFDFTQHRRLVADWRPEWYPGVDVFLPVCGEPLEVLSNTWTYVDRVRRHYRGRVVAYVLDDAASPEVQAMARQFGFTYVCRPDRGWYKKSGNLLHGFRKSFGEFVLLLDADFAPRHDFLDETLPYMDAHPDAGIVQTPQFFRIADRQTWAARMISGWAHFFAHCDKLRSTEMSWKPSGAEGKSIRNDRFWTGFLVWSAGSCLVWTVLAFWRMVTMNPMDFVTLFAFGPSRSRCNRASHPAAD